ncbi:hypothetical protein WK33_19860 [Burkholderia multivorans]|nr:hypothetical protein AI46_22165 [Burkholderia multivorans R-20526]KVS10558.1 hypothetical protein WK33_19860 [Burkholderia multivorans]OFT80563.1 hypothetical protein HMPREF3115_22545 [Burkholderia sp. HMSC10F09]
MTVLQMIGRAGGTRLQVIARSLSDRLRGERASDQAPGGGERRLGRGSSEGTRQTTDARTHAGRTGRRKLQGRGRVHGE